MDEDGKDAYVGTDDKKGSLDGVWHEERPAHFLRGR